MESQVIVDHQVTVNKFLDLVHTARHATEIGLGRNGYVTVFILKMDIYRNTCEIGVGNWGEVVTG